MEYFHLLPIFALLCVFVKGCNAILPAEMYWQSKLPNTRLPKVLQDLLKPDTGNKISFSESEAQVDPYHEEAYGLSYWAEAKQFEENEILNTTTIFFLYDDLVPGKKMNIILTKSKNRSTFLPRKIAKTIPFSSTKLPEILKYLSIKPKSKEAQLTKDTIKECEIPAIRGEDKYCATSLESLVDFVITRFGNKVQIFSNDAKEDKKNKEYTILKEVKMLGDNQIVCHKETYAYAVFYCHKLMNTKAYMVPLVGDDGFKAKSLVVCHFDTSTWNPEHFAFHVLNVKPGGPPVCHILSSDTIVWVPN